MKKFLTFKKRESGVKKVLREEIKIPDQHIDKVIEGLPVVLTQNVAREDSAKVLSALTACNAEAEALSLAFWSVSLEIQNVQYKDELLEVLGVEVIDWDFKTECCGAGLSVSKTESVCELSGRVIREAVWQKADAIVVACQLCQANLDMRQDEIYKNDPKKYKIPVIYFTQLLGLAFGMPAKELKLSHHLVNPMPILKKKGFVS